jgi:hypothetical protein
MTPANTATVAKVRTRGVIRVFLGPAMLRAPCEGQAVTHKPHAPQSMHRVGSRRTTKVPAIRVIMVPVVSTAQKDGNGI